MHNIATESERVETPTPRNGAPELSANEYFVGGKEVQSMRQASPALPTEMASNACLLTQLMGLGPHSARTEPVMAAVDRNTAEANSLFPNDENNGNYLRDFGLPSNAAYRYLMNKEGLDDYSSTNAADMAQLEAARPGSIRELDNFIADQVKQGLVPQNTRKQCAE
jgi:hypothetical protein